MSRRADPIERIVKFNEGRDPDLLALKYEAMRDNALGFFRGTCHIFWSDWPRSTPLNDMPPVWSCGDLHVDNVGGYLGEDGLLYFDIVDFDEAVLAPCTLDLVRLATSALIACKVHHLKRQRSLALCNAFLDAYVVALRDGKARWIERDRARGMIAALIRRLERRTRAAFIAKRTEPRSRATRIRIDGDHTLPIADDDRKRVERFMRKFAEHQSDPRFFRCLDVARRVAGIGALGLERYTILVEGGGVPSRRCLLDLKFASPSALADHATPVQPQWRDDAARVVAVERRMQAIEPAFLHAVTIEGKAYVLRELMPTADKLDLAKWKGEPMELDRLALDLGSLVAWSALRSGGRDGSATIDDLRAFAHRAKWRRWLIDYAASYRDVAWQDWKRFREARDDGAQL